MSDRKREDVVPDMADSYALLDNGQILGEVEPLYDPQPPDSDFYRWLKRRMEGNRWNS